MTIKTLLKQIYWIYIQKKSLLSIYIIYYIIQINETDSKIIKRVNIKMSNHKKTTILYDIYNGRFVFEKNRI